MRFDKLNEMIPYVTGGKSKILKMSPYNAVTLRMPGRHAQQTLPIGGDFVVCVDDDKMDWIEHQFTHTDIFDDLEAKAKKNQKVTNQLMIDYLALIADNAMMISWASRQGLPGIHPSTFLESVQCLAVAEHRRYAQHEVKFGGRFLPFRFGAGIVEGLWTANKATERQRRGRLGVEWLEKDFGVPALTKELMND